MALNRRQKAERLVLIRRWSLARAERARRMKQAREKESKHPDGVIEIDPEILSEIRLALKDSPAS